MSGIERRHQKRMDEMVLGASPEELARLQALDVQTQLSGSSFYENYSLYGRDGLEAGPEAAEGQKRRTNLV